MSSWLVTLSSEQADVDVELLDTIGPINRWKSRSPGAFAVDEDSFTNQTGDVVARGCGVQACWTLRRFDIDKVKPGAKGAGINNDAQGSFPVGELSWLVKARL